MVGAGPGERRPEASLAHQGSARAGRIKARCKEPLVRCGIGVVLESRMHAWWACSNAAGAALLTQVSPVAWQHINLWGRYECTKAPEVINMAAIIQALAQAAVLHDLAL